MALAHHQIAGLLASLKCAVAETRIELRLNDWQKRLRTCQFLLSHNISLNNCRSLTLHSEESTELVPRAAFVDDNENTLAAEPAASRVADTAWISSQSCMCTT